MSGTSHDGIDIGMVETDGYNYIKLLDARTISYPATLQHDIAKLMNADYTNVWSVEYAISELHSNATREFINDFGAPDIIGFHGQSIHHDPAHGICAQIGNPHILSASLKLDIVYDFRRRDVACGGQGAPLVPIFLKAIRPYTDKPMCFLNIGGVANICYISEDDLIAFDTGCGNAPLNDTCKRFLNLPYDDMGKLAASGKVHKESLQILCKDAYFSKAWPKSLDRNHFDFSLLATLSIPDMLATIVEFIACSIKFAVDTLPKTPGEIIISGGGTHNEYLITRISSVTEIKATPSGTYDLPSDYLEAYAFAYLAVRTKLKLPISFPTTTGVLAPMTGGVLVQGS